MTYGYDPVVWLNGQELGEMCTVNISNELAVRFGQATKSILSSQARFRKRGYLCPSRAGKVVQQVKTLPTNMMT